MENQEERWPNWPPGSRFTLIGFRRGRRFWPMARPASFDNGNGTAKGKEQENSDGLVARLY